MYFLLILEMRMPSIEKLPNRVTKFQFQIVVLCLHVCCSYHKMSITIAIHGVKQTYTLTYRKFSHSFLIKSK